MSDWLRNTEAKDFYTWIREAREAEIRNARKHLLLSYLSLGLSILAVCMQFCR